MDTITVLMHSWRDGTKQCYRPYITKWFQFCSSRCVNPFKPPVPTGLAFLSSLNHKGCSYSQINTARSALSALILSDHLTWGSLPIVKRFMKGIYELKPTFPRYHMIWDVHKVFNFFRTLPQPADLDLKMLSHKLALLLVLLSGGQRCQTIHQINVLDIKIVNKLMVVPLFSKLKHSRVGAHLEPLKFPCYVKEPTLCVVTHMTEYLKRTHLFRGQCAKLFLAINKPHQEVSRDTISRWCKTILAQCGIDISVYSSHSSRAAASSMAKQRGVSLPQIARFAGWSGERVFAKFYDKPIIVDNVFQQNL